MPTPLAKGIVITVAVLVAAGLAVYENPQVRQWVDASRRKIAVALHGLGDGINPKSHSSTQRDDISMSEDLSEEAEERRRKAREEIMRRGAILEAHRKRKSTRSVGSFDCLVDKDGRLKEDKPERKESHTTATAVDPSDSGLTRRHPGDITDLSQSISDMAPQITPEHRRAIRESIDRSRLHIALTSETSSNHPSESLVDLTPTSDFPDTDLISSTHREAERSRQEPASNSEYFSVVSSRSSIHTEDGEPDFYYAHPHSLGQNTAGPDTNNSTSPFGNQPNYHQVHDVSSVPSIASSLSHIRNDPFNDSSDTLSDLGHADEGIRTPASWSEIGSVVSSNDGNHH